MSMPSASRLSTLPIVWPRIDIPERKRLDGVLCVLWHIVRIWNSGDFLGWQMKAVACRVQRSWSFTCTGEERGKDVTKANDCYQTGLDSDVTGASILRKYNCCNEVFCFRTRTFQHEMYNMCKSLELVVSELWVTRPRVKRV